MMASLSAGGALDDGEFAWVLESLDFKAKGVDDVGDTAWDAALLDTLLTAEPSAAPSERPATPGCRIRGCVSPLSAGYSQRAKLCESHLHAQSVPLPDTGEPGRFCQRCHKLQALGAFSGRKRTCDAALQQFNKKRRAAHSQQAAAKAEACTQLAVCRPLRDANPLSSLPLTLELQLRERLSNFLACTDGMRLRLLTTLPPALQASDLRLLRFCVPPTADACAQLKADAAALVAQRSSLTPEQAAASPAWCAPVAPAAQRAEAHVAALASWAARAAEAAGTAAGSVAAAEGRELCAAMRPCVEGMNALLAHTQSALALMRLESRGRYLAGAALACELGASLMTRAEEVCKERSDWLDGSQLQKS